MATNSVRTTLTTASGRSRDAILRTRGVDSRPHGWQTLYQGHGDSSLQPPGTSPSAPTDRDGDSRNCDDFDRPTSQANSRRQGSSQYNHCPPSALNPSRASAVSRAASYTPYKRPPSYSRSIVPDHEDDYLRLRRLANRGARLPREEYKPGLIIRAPLHEQDSRGDSRPLGSASSIGSCTSEATMAEKYTTPSRFGPIFTKYRKMIVVACHQDNYVAVPLYTHNGKGLIHKARPEEFVSVQDHRAKDEDCMQLSRWEPLITEYVKDGIDLFESKTTAHLAYPVSRNYRLPVVKEGWLRGSSLRTLKDVYGRFAGVDG